MRFGKRHALCWPTDRANPDTNQESKSKHKFSNPQSLVERKRSLANAFLYACIAITGLLLSFCPKWAYPTRQPMYSSPLDYKTQWMYHSWPEDISRVRALVIAIDLLSTWLSLQSTFQLYMLNQQREYLPQWTLWFSHRYPKRQHPSNWCRLENSQQISK